MLHKYGQKCFAHVDLPIALRIAIKGGLLSVAIASGMILDGCEAELTDSQYVARARELSQKGNLAASAIQLRNALQLNPSNAEARWLLGNLYLETGNPDGAEKELRQALTLRVARAAVAVPLAQSLLYQGKFRELLAETVPDDLTTTDRVELLVLRIQAWLSQGDHAKAETEIIAARKIAPDAAITLLGEAFVGLSQGKYADAESWARQALERSPSLAEAWSLVGDMERLRGKLSEAESSYTKAIESRRRNFVDILKRAETRIELGHLAKANDDLRALMPSGTRIAQVHYLIGLVAYRENRLDDARTAFQEALRLKPEHAAANLYLGTVYLLLKNYEIAAIHLERSANAMPDMFDAARQLAALYFLRGEYARAEARLKPFAQARSNDPRLLSLRGEILLKLGQTQAGLHDLRQVVETEPNSAIARLHLGMALITAGARDDGLASLEKAITLNPTFKEAEVAITVANLRVGAFDAAIEAARRWRERHPDDISALNFIGIAQAAQRNVTAARQAFSEMQKKAPTDPVATFNLALLDLKDGKAIEARSRLETLLITHPNDIPTLYQLAKIEVSTGNRSSAVQLLERARSADPEALGPRILLARLYTEHGQAMAAISVLRELGARYENEQHFLLALADAQINAGQGSNARATLERLDKLNPGNAEVQFMIAQAELLSGNREKSRQALERSLQLDPEKFQTSLALSRLLLLNGDVSGANKALQSAEARFPNHPALHLQRSRIAIAAGTPNSALAELETIPEAERDQTVILLLMKLQFQSSRLDDALNTGRAWLAAHQDDITVKMVIADLLDHAGQIDEAIAIYENVLIRAPDNVVALNNLALILRRRNPDRAFALLESAVQRYPDMVALIDSYGQLLLDRGQTEQAVRVLSKARERDSNNAEIVLHLTQALIQSQRLTEAKQLVREFLAREEANLQDSTRNELRNLLAKP